MVMEASGILHDSHFPSLPRCNSTFRSGELGIGFEASAYLIGCCRQGQGLADQSKCFLYNPIRERILSRNAEIGQCGEHMGPAIGPSALNHQAKTKASADHFLGEKVGMRPVEPGVGRVTCLALVNCRSL